ncbi:MAG: bifunctional folylpolyglutamate synthase/dihydrofolate synthase [Candidatus Cloacimonetes bacterium]|nr:bifunctional folylpolyglutamate synthase/dihydrofolate synthase [Candidatus Cloacimonadota bacterium]
MTYKEFLNLITQRHSGNVKYNLDRMHAILKAMDSPETQMQGIHIAGTNGKGSTAAMCEVIAIAHRQSTGLNTSPHLVDYRERIRFSGNNITATVLMDTYAQWKQLFEEQEASFFEITTAMAFYLFHRKKVDTAIFEVGLGGRLDGTNPFQSTVSVITSIALDHPKSLGDTLEQIAAEKAGIFKPGVSVVLGKLPDVALAVILKKAGTLDIPVYKYGEQFAVENVTISTSGTSFDYSFAGTNGIPSISMKQLKINLLGKYQAYNAACAITSFLIYCHKLNLNFNVGAVRSALPRINWKGRLQLIHSEPTVVLDGAHNEEGVTHLVENMRYLFPTQRIRVVVAILRDKKLDKMIADLCAIAFKVYISKNKSNRAAEIEEQEAVARQSGVPYSIAFDVLEATTEAMKESAPDDVILITGSLYTISEILANNSWKL